MDATELFLLTALRKNARTSLLGLAKTLNVPASTLHDKMHRQHGRSIIKHTTLLDFEKLGYTRTYIAVKATQQSRHRVQAFLASNWGVNNLHRTNSGFEFLAEIVAKDPKEIEDFTAELKTLNGVIEVQKFSIIEDLMREKFNFDEESGR